MNRAKRVATAQHTLATLEQGHYQNQKGDAVEVKTLQSTALASTRLYKTPELEQLIDEAPTTNSFSTTYEVTNETTLNAARRLYDANIGEVLALNFASARNPGGGVLTGASAQEESIARASGLYPCLLEASEYYEHNRALPSGFYSDYLIYSPRVPVIKDEKGALLDQPVPISIITSPAVNAGVVKLRMPKRIPEIESAMRRRIAMVLAVAAQHQHTNLVLGAWGCGVFQNDPKQIARLFKEILTEDFTGQFERVVFAVYTRNEERFLQPFAEQFTVSV